MKLLDLGGSLYYLYSDAIKCRYNQVVLKASLSW